MLLNDSRGRKSLTTTFSVVAFIVTMVKFLVAGAAINVGSFSYSFGEVDAASIAALLTPTFGLYAFRRHTEATYPEDTGPHDDDGEEGAA